MAMLNYQNVSHHYYYMFIIIPSIIPIKFHDSPNDSPNVWYPTLLRPPRFILHLLQDLQGEAIDAVELAASIGLTTTKASGGVKTKHWWAYKGTWWDVFALIYWFVDWFIHLFSCLFILLVSYL